MLQVFKQQIDNAADLLLGKRGEKHRLINPVEELWTEGAAQQRVHRFIGLLRDASVRADRVEQDVRPQVGGHDDNSIFEVHCPALRIGDPPVVKDLKKDIEDVGMRFFHLIEQYDRVGLTADRLGQLAALIVADVSGRRPNQTGDGVFLHIFAHIDPHHAAFIIEKRLCQRLGQLGLADAGRAEKEEGADRTVGVGDAGTRAENGFADPLYCLILTNNPFVQDLRQGKQFFPFALHQLGDRDTGPAGNDTGDLIVSHPVPQKGVALLLPG